VVQLRDEPPAGGVKSVVRGAVTLAAEPRFSISVSRHVRVQAAAGVGSALHGILLRQDGIPTTSLTGFFASGSLGAIVEF
jgi:hypothetical protein